LLSPQPRLKPSSPDKTYDEEQNDRTKCGNNSAPDERIGDRDGYAKTREEIPGDNPSKDSDDNVANNAKSTALYNKAGKKASYGADKKPDHDGFHMIPPNAVGPSNPNVAFQVVLSLNLLLNNSAAPKFQRSDLF
jgi:hypothetical protein